MTNQYCTTLLKERLIKFQGHYECHITIDLANENEARFAELCRDLDSKAIIIQLESGKTSRQPMLCKRLSGSPDEAVKSIEHLLDALEAEFSVSRLKVEAAIVNQGIPKNRDEIVANTPDCYFEHHVKIALENTVDLQNLKNRLKEYGGHLSRNAIHKEAAIEYRFVTQRLYQAGLDEAKASLDSLTDYLKSEGIKIEKVIREFNIYDSNLDLDAGWISDK